MGTSIMYSISVTLILLILIGISGCLGSDSSSNHDSAINISVTDTPVDGADSVVVAFTGIDFMGPAGQTSIQFGTEWTMDLLKLQGNVSAVLLKGAAVPAGHYQWLRLDMDTTNSYVISSTGGVFPLTVPSGDQSSLQLVSGFTLAQGDVADFMIDFNLRQALTLHRSGGTVTYMLGPALRLINLQQAGTIAGTVPSSQNIGGIPITVGTCSPAVYIYQGTGVIPEGFDVYVAGGSMPFTSASVSLDTTTGKYVYMVGFLAPGAYTLAVTCAGMDMVGSTTLAFSPSQYANVTANREITTNF